MPTWLEVLVNLAGYAGFLTLAAHGGNSGQPSNDDHRGGGNRI